MRVTTIKFGHAKTSLVHGGLYINYPFNGEFLHIVLHKLAGPHSRYTFGPSLTLLRSAAVSALPILVFPECCIFHFSSHHYLLFYADLLSSPS